jgi:hypothetical protein
MELGIIAELALVPWEQSTGNVMEEKRRQLMPLVALRIGLQSLIYCGPAKVEDELLGNVLAFVVRQSIPPTKILQCFDHERPISIVSKLLQLPSP